MRDYQRKHAVKRLPSLLEFLGFAFFFPSFLAGPTMEMSDYLAFIDGSMFNDCPNQRPPQSLLATLITLGKAMLCLPGPILGNVFFPCENFLTQPFLEAPFLIKYPPSPRVLCVWPLMTSRAQMRGSVVYIAPGARQVLLWVVHG